MNTPSSRRLFLKNLAAASGLLFLPVGSMAAGVANSLTTPRFKFGYAANTWDTQPNQAIKDISELGFKAIQLQARVINKQTLTPESLKETLRKFKLELPILACGLVDIYTAQPTTSFEMPLQYADFAKKAGIEYIQVTGSPYPATNQLNPQDLTKLGKQLNELGKRLQLDYGLKLAFSNHIHYLGASPAELDKVMAATDPNWVKLILDTGHYRQADGNPILAIRQYRDRLVHLYLNDVMASASLDGSDKNYQFVELGRGNVNFPAVFAALRDAQFKGWCIIKLDTLPAQTRTPRECAQISKNYISQQLKFKM